MKRGKVFFHPIDGTAALTISWAAGPKGDAIEAKKGSGVGFFSEKGELLCVIFDEVHSENDSQTLEFKNYSVSISVKDNIVKFKLISSNPSQQKRKRTPLKISNKKRKTPRSPR